MTATTIDDARPRARSLSIPYPELLGLLAVAAALNLWGLSQNGFANTYNDAQPARSISRLRSPFALAST